MKNLQEGYTLINTFITALATKTYQALLIAFKKLPVTFYQTEQTNLKKLLASLLVLKALPLNFLSQTEITHLQNLGHDLRMHPEFGEEAFCKNLNPLLEDNAVFKERYEYTLALINSENISTLFYELIAVDSQSSNSETKSKRGESEIESTNSEPEIEEKGFPPGKLSPSQVSTIFDYMLPILSSEDPQTLAKENKRLESFHKRI